MQLTGNSNYTQHSSSSERDICSGGQDISHPFPFSPEANYRPPSRMNPAHILIVLVLKSILTLSSHPRAGLKCHLSHTHLPHVHYKPCSLNLSRTEHPTTFLNRINNESPLFATFSSLLLLHLS